MDNTNGKQITDDQRITIENVGPINGQFSIDLSAGPGVYILRGSKGSGKSHTLSCLDLLAGHSADITLHDGAQSGRISGFGVVVPIGLSRKANGSAKISRKGEFSAHTLDAEQFTISDITDPGIKDPVKADAHRIKALAALARTRSEPSDYHDLAGGKDEFERLVKADAMDTDDPVLLASRIKAAFDAAARNAETLADRAEGQAQACQAAVADIDIDAECDPRSLADAVDAAVAERSRLKTLRDAAQRGAKLREQAQYRLDRTRAAHKGPTVREAQSEHDEADGEVTHFANMVDDLRIRLAVAESMLAKAKQRRDHAKAAITNAKQHAELVAQLEELLAQPVAESPSVEEVAAADQALEDARARQKRGVLILEAKRRWDDGNTHLAESGSHRERAERMREASGGVFDVLMRSVKLDGVRVETIDGAPRLMVDHPRRGPTLFAQLSDGERTRKVIDVLAPLLPSPGLFPLSQRLSQDLAPSDFRDLDTLAKERGIYCLAALVDDGELRVDRWEDGDANE